MNHKIKAAVLLFIISGAGVWAFLSFRTAATGGEANNGAVAEDFGPPRGPRGGPGGDGRGEGGPPPFERLSEAQRTEMEAAREAGDFEKMRGIMESAITPEDRERMEERRQEMQQRMEERRQKTEAILGPEQSAQLDAKMRSRFRGGRGPRGGFGGRPGGAFPGGPPSRD